MTFLENKKIFLSLVDEYAPDNELLTEDDDIPIKVAWLYAPAYEELASRDNTLKTKEISIETSGDGYTEYSMPNCKQVKRVVGLDENNKKISADYYTLGKKIYVNNSVVGRYIIEYTPFFQIITDQTPDDFELEISQDLQGVLPYLVASDLLKTDPSANWQAFEKVLQRKLESLNTAKKGISVNITEGEI